MARAIHKLTPGRAASKANKIGLHGDGGGLYLRVSSPGARSWVFRYMIDGKSREMGLGSYDAIGLDIARGKAKEAREHKTRGKDPITARESWRALERAQAA